jgi:hypothetical protein
VTLPQEETKTMKRIIDGRIYDTATAEEICELRNTANRGDFRWEATSLYRSPKGAFFLAGQGGAMSRWAQAAQGGGHGGGEGMVLVPEDEARALVEEHASVAVYVATFGKPVEG